MNYICWVVVVWQYCSFDTSLLDSLVLVLASAEDNPAAVGTGKDYNENICIKSHQQVNQSTTKYRENK